MGAVIVNYGMGNLRSVFNACEVLGFPARIAEQPSELDQGDRIILPGVGAFGDAMRNLSSAGWLEALENEVRVRGKNFLGVCLGMQVLATKGTEFGTHQGLGWIDGTVERIEPGEAGLRVPHMGWDSVRIARPEGLLAGLEDNSTFYFVHSYVVRPEDPSVVSAWCDYGGDFAAAVERENVTATQFHPEKSQKAGLAVLRNFLSKGA